MTIKSGGVMIIVRAPDGTQCALAGSETATQAVEMAMTAAGWDYDEAEDCWVAPRPTKPPTPKDHCRNDMIEEYELWQAAHGLKLRSADDHVDDTTIPEPLRDWLRRFSQRWEDNERGDRDRKVTIHVRGGIAEVGELDSDIGVDVTIIDHDNDSPI